MTPIYLALDLTDASTLADRLQRHGIDAHIRNEALSDAEFCGSVYPQVCIIDPNDYRRASAIKAEHEQALLAPILGQDRRCAACSQRSPANFDRCWSCRQPFLLE